MYVCMYIIELETRRNTGLKRDDGILFISM